MRTTHKPAIKAFHETRPVVTQKPSPPGSFLGMVVVTAVALFVSEVAAQTSSATNVPSTNTDVAVFAGVAVATTALIVGLGVGCAIRRVLIRNCEERVNRVTPLKNESGVLIS